MIKTVIIGAAGRMGRMLIANIAANSRFQLAGATEYDACPLLGQDAGTVAGVGELGVAITSDLNAVLASHPDVVINFATAGVLEATRAAVAAGAAVVIGSTILTADDKAEFKKMADAGARLVVAGNYSIGVNLLFKLVREATGLNVKSFLSGSQGGDQQIGARIAYNEIDLVLFFRDPLTPKATEPNDMDMLRMCDMRQIPVATNIATAEVLIHGLERGDLDWRNLINPSNGF